MGTKNSKLTSVRNYSEEARRKLLCNFYSYRGVVKPLLNSLTASIFKNRITEVTYEIGLVLRIYKWQWLVEEKRSERADIQTAYWYFNDELERLMQADNERVDFREERLPHWINKYEHDRLDADLDFIADEFKKQGPLKYLPGEAVAAEPFIENCLWGSEDESSETQKSHFWHLK